MNFKIISTVISREYTTKVKKKSFLITTLIVPVIIAVGIFIMIQLVSNMTPRAQQVAVIDHTGGIVMPYLENNSSNTYTDCSSQTEEDMKGSLDKSGMDVLLVISELDSLNNVSVQAYSRKPLTVEFSGIVKRQVNKAIESYKISTYKDIENLESIIRDVKSDASLTEFLLDESGNESLSESGVYQGVSMIMGIFIFMFITMFGSMVMSSVIEEKSSRVVEVLISSAKATELMFGKIIGVALVALTQFFLWILLTAGIIFVLGSMTGGLQDAAQSAAMMEMAGNSGVNINAGGGDAAVLLSTLVKIPWGTMILSFVVYFVLGYLLYSSMFAAIGSAVENEGETQQLQLPLTIPLMIGYMIILFAARNTDSSTVVWGSMIPFTSPIVMLARIPYGVPAWELALSIFLLLVTFIVMAWISAKIYRVGILMYGKKSSFKDLWNWLKQK
ncbi:MAG: ABC transporter permease [Bacteroidales bacterium]|nr:ABC transporter permease [Bacteroidales bacterium]